MYEPYVRPFVAEDAKAQSRETAFRQILTLLRHPSVDVQESEDLLRQFIRQCQFDAWEAGYEVGEEDEHRQYEDRASNPYAEEV